MEMMNKLFYSDIIQWRTLNVGNLEVHTILVSIGIIYSISYYKEQTEGRSYLTKNVNGYGYAIGR